MTCRRVSAEATSRRETLVFRRMAASVILGLVFVALPGLVLAANVSANCHTYGGTFITYGTADNWQDHVHDGEFKHSWYYGRQYIDEGWGFETGTETGTVNGPNLTGAGAACPA